MSEGTEGSAARQSPRSLSQAVREAKNAAADRSDVVVDLRVGSPTFGAWDSVLLDDESREAVFLSEGLGHAFLSLQDGSVVTYLCSAPYAPAGEHGINPLDPALGITWPTHGRNGAPLSVLLSDKDRDAPSLAEALETNLLPRHDDVQSFIATL